MRYEWRKIFKLIGEIELQNISENKFDDEEIAKLYYLSENYQKSKEFYSKIKKQNYEIATWWIVPYFYSIKKLGKINELKTEFENIMYLKDKEIEEVKNGEYKKEWTKYKKRTEIREIKRQIKQLKSEYIKILKTGYKPEIKIYPKFYMIAF